MRRPGDEQGRRRGGKEGQKAPKLIVLISESDRNSPLGSGSMRAGPGVGGPITGVYYHR